MAQTTDQCEIYCYDPEKVTRLQSHINNIEAQQTAQLFKVLADETRYKIAYALSLEGELCGCDLANIIGASTATVSHHLRVLRNVGAATYRREGKLVFYTLASPRIHHFLHEAENHQKGGRLGV